MDNSYYSESIYVNIHVSGIQSIKISPFLLLVLSKLALTSGLLVIDPSSTFVGNFSFYQMKQKLLGCRYQCH